MHPRSSPFSLRVTNTPRSCWNAAKSEAAGSYNFSSRTAVSTDFFANWIKVSFSFEPSENDSACAAWVCACNNATAL